MKMPIPSDWDGQSWAAFIVCVPDSAQWRAIVRGKIYDLTWYKTWDKSTGSLNDVKAVANEIYESIEMACLSDLKRMADGVEKLAAIMAGESVVLQDDQGQPVTHDYTGSGVVPTLNTLFTTSEELFYDSRNIAEILSVGLIGRKLNLIPLPWEGTGLADITDDALSTLDAALDTLQSRFVMRDSSLFNPLFGEKNIVEALETLLRLDTVTDLELRPNIASLLSTGDSSSLIGGLKFIIQKWREKLNLPPALSEWLDSKLEAQKHMSAGDLLLLIATALQAMEGELGDLDASTVVNLLNTNNCNGDGVGTPGAPSPAVTVQMTDDGISVEEPPPELQPG